MNIKKIGSYFNEFFEPNVKEKFKTLIIAITRIIDDLYIINGLNDIITFSTQESNISDDKLLTKILADSTDLFKQQLKEYQEKIANDLENLESLKTLLPIKIKFNFYDSLIKDIEKAKTKKDKIMNKILLYDIRSHINMLRGLEEVVQTILIKR